MPMPTVPRRAGPPRNYKSVNPPPEVPEERVELERAIAVPSVDF
jgi:hypothetical protein